MVRFAPDYKSFVYAVAGRSEVRFTGRLGVTAFLLGRLKSRSESRSPSRSSTKAMHLIFRATFLSQPQ
jgi:hypothetical protein